MRKNIMKMDSKSLKVRNGIHITLVEAVRRGNEGDKRLLLKTLEAITELPNYDLVFGADLERGVIVYDKLYTAKEKTMVITENGNRLFVIYKDKKDGVTGLDVEDYYLTAGETHNIDSIMNQLEEVANNWNKIS